MYENWKTRASLLQRAQDPDDHSAWDEFVSVYGKFIGTVIGKSGVKFDDIDDLVQVVLLKVWKGLPNYEYRKDEAKFRSWLSVIIRNAVNDHVYHKNRSGGDKFSLDDEVICQLSSDALEQRIEREWQLHITDLAIDRVKEHFSGQAVDVFFKSLKGADAQDIADELGLTLQTVYVLRSRVKSALRKEIESLRERVELH